jgi:DNA-binding helix-hairpin-helix protein with protein kinase domain
MPDFIINGKKITLSSPFNGGKQGDLYCHPHDARLVVKVYTSPTPEDERRIAWMVWNQPSNRLGPSGKPFFTWPIDVVIDPTTGQRIGFTLEYLDQYVPLQRIYDPASRLSCITQRFRNTTAKSFCESIDVLHRNGIALGDISLFNAMADRNGHVTQIDTDSGRITAGTVVYPSRYGLYEFAAAELQGVAFANVDRTQEHDRHAVGVVVFMLVTSMPPYRCHYVGRGTCPTDCERIRLGLWPYSGKHADFQPPRDAPPFSALDPRLQDLFRRTFNEGHANPAARPTPAEYADVLREISAVGVVPAQIPDLQWQAHFPKSRFTASFKQPGRTGKPQPHPVVQQTTGRARTRKWQVASATLIAASLVISALLWLLDSSPDSLGRQLQHQTGHVDVLHSEISSGNQQSNAGDPPVLWRQLKEMR